MSEQSLNDQTTLDVIGNNAQILMDAVNNHLQQQPLEFPEQEVLAALVRDVGSYQTLLERISDFSQTIEDQSWHGFLAVGESALQKHKQQLEEFTLEQPEEELLQATDQLISTRQELLYFLEQSENQLYLLLGPTDSSALNRLLFTYNKLQEDFEQYLGAWADAVLRERLRTYAHLTTLESDEKQLANNPDLHHALEEYLKLLNTLFQETDAGKQTSELAPTLNRVQESLPKLATLMQAATEEQTKESSYNIEALKTFEQATELLLQERLGLQVWRQQLLLFTRIVESLPETSQDYPRLAELRKELLEHLSILNELSNKDTFEPEELRQQFQKAYTVLEEVDFELGRAQKDLERASRIICPRCGSENQTGEFNCQQCGFQFPITEVQEKTTNLDEVKPESLPEAFTPIVPMIYALRQGEMEPQDFAQQVEEVTPQLMQHIASIMKQPLTQSELELAEDDIFDIVSRTLEQTKQQALYNTQTGLELLVRFAQEQDLELGSQGFHHLLAAGNNIDEYSQVIQELSEI